MLTSAQALAAYVRGRAHPDRLTRKAHARYLAYAEKMLAVYRGGLGRTRRELHGSIAGLLAHEPECPARRVQAFCKLLDDAGEYETDRRGRAAELRLRVFARAARLHPLVAEADRLFETAEAAAKLEIAAELGRPWEEIERGLYADVLDQQPLRAFQGYAGGAALLARYNVAQCQACLYRAEHMTVHATRDFKTLLRYAKLAGLLLEIAALGPSEYRIELTGPATVLRRTGRYGVNLARFLPALLACAGWRMSARLRTPWGAPARLDLTCADGLRGHLPPPEAFDSSVEERFAHRFGAERAGWRLLREGTILRDGQTVFVPDFVFRHASGAEALFEIVGFWTPEYLAKKRETLRRFRSQRILLAVPERLARGGAHEPGLVTYKTAVKVQDVLEKLSGWIR